MTISAGNTLRPFIPIQSLSTPSTRPNAYHQHIPDRVSIRFGETVALPSSLPKSTELRNYTFNLFKDCVEGNLEDAKRKVQGWRKDHPDFLTLAAKVKGEHPESSDSAFLTDLAQAEDQLLAGHNPEARQCLAKLAARQIIRSLKQRRPGVIPHYIKTLHAPEFEQHLTEHLAYLCTAVLFNTRSTAAAHFRQTLFWATAFKGTASPQTSNEWNLLFQDLGLAKLDTIISQQPAIPEGVRKIEDLPSESAEQHLQLLKQTQKELLDKIKNFADKRAKSILG